MQDNLYSCYQFLAIEAIDDKDRRRREIEGSQLLGDPVQSSDSAAVIVLVMADDQLFGHSLDPRRIASERFYLIGHHSSFPISRAGLSRLSRSRLDCPLRATAQGFLVW